MYFARWQHRAGADISAKSAARASPIGVEICMSSSAKVAASSSKTTFLPGYLPFERAVEIVIFRRTGLANSCAAGQLRGVACAALHRMAINDMYITSLSNEEVCAALLGNEEESKK